MKRYLLPLAILFLLAACGENNHDEDIVLLEGPATVDGSAGGELREGSLEDGRVIRPLDGGELILNFSQGVLENRSFPVAVSFAAILDERTFSGEAEISDVERNENGIFEGSATVEEQAFSLLFQLPPNLDGVVDVIRFEWIEPMDTGPDHERSILLAGRLRTPDVVLAD